VESFSRNIVKIAIDGDEGKVIEFNPNDMLLRNRITEFMVNVQTKQDEMTKKAEALDAGEQPADGALPANIKDVLAFNQEVADYFIGELDDIFGKGASAKLFGERSFDPDLMASFMAYVMDKIGKVSNAKIEQKLGKPLKAPKAK
jgi:hypothetical protein